MSPPNLHHEYVDANGRPHTEIDLAYPDADKSGRILLTISENRPPNERGEALDEYKRLADALQFDSKIDPRRGTIDIDTGTRSPEGLMLFISSSLEERNLIVNGEARKGIEAVLQHESPQQTTAMSMQEISNAAMRSALDQMLAAGAADGFARSGAKHTTVAEIDPHAAAPQRVPNVVEIAQGQGKGRGIV